MEMSEKGPKYGWILGGLGSILWLPILSIVLLVKGNLAGFLSGIIFFAVCAAYLYFLAPWRYPRTPLRWIYLGFVAILLFAAFLMVALWHPREMTRWREYRVLLPLVSLLIPVFVFGRKTWADMHRPKNKP
jgi:hypothetical protein